MFSSHTTIEKLTAEVLINITSFLDVASILQFSLSAKAFRHLIQDELVFRQLVERDYRVTEKQPEEAWVDVYKQKKLDQRNTVNEQTVEEGVTTTTTTATTTITAATISEEAVDTPTTQEEPMDTAEKGTVTEPSQETIAAAVEEQATIEQEVAVEQKFVAKNEAVIKEEAAVEKKAQKESAVETTIATTEPSIQEVEAKPEAALVVEENTSAECPHLEKVSDSINEIKRIIYKIENPTLCDLCLSRTSSYLNMSDSCHIEACRSCLETKADDEEHFPVQLELSTGDLYCFKCKENDGTPRRLVDEKAQKIMEYVKAPQSDNDLDKRRKAEHQLYVQELRREDMSLKHYLVEKQWGRTWMLFRTREGSPLPGKISNQKLARLNGTLDPNIRLPMDKYRPSPETHGDIVSERLWSYLAKAYGVQGRAYSEDDIIAPEYARLRVYVDDFKKSINLYP